MRTKSVTVPHSPPHISCGLALRFNPGYRALASWTCEKYPVHTAR